MCITGWITAFGRTVVPTGYSADMGVRQRHSLPLDTSVEARDRQIEAWIAMGPEKRVRLAASMSDDVRRVATEGAAARTPRSPTGVDRPR